MLINEAADPAGVIEALDDMIRRLQSELVFSSGRGGGLQLIGLINCLLIAAYYRVLPGVCGVVAQGCADLLDPYRVGGFR